MEKFLKRFERFIILGLLVMMVLVVFLGTVELAVVIVEQMMKPPKIFLLNINEMLTIFGFFFMILIGLELLETIKDAVEVNSPSTNLVVLKGSTSQTFIEKIIPRANLLTRSTHDEAVDMVIQGKVHAMVADYPICVVSVFRYPEAGLFSLVTPLTYEPIGIALSAEDPLLVNWVQNFLTTVEDSGDLDAIKEHWFKNPSWLKRLP